MRRSSLTSVLLVAAIGLSAPAQAQVWSELREQSADEIARGQTDFWARTLGLNTEQAGALHQINLRYASDMRLAARLPGDDAGKLDGIESLEDARSAEVLEVLTTEQRQRYMQFMEHRQHLVKEGAIP